MYLITNEDEAEALSKKARDIETKINSSNPFNNNISEKSNSYIFNNISKDLNIENKSFISMQHQ